MPSATYLATVHDRSRPADMVQAVEDAAKAVGIDDTVRKDRGQKLPQVDMAKGAINVTLFPDHTSLNDPTVTVSFEQYFNLEGWHDLTEYVELFDNSVELLCQLAIRFDAAYLPLLKQAHWNDIVPSETPLVDHIKKLPLVGIYSEEFLSDLGGIDSLQLSRGFDNMDESVETPWRLGTLETGHTLAIMTEYPWKEAGWTESSHRDLRAPRESDTT